MEGRDNPRTGYLGGEVFGRTSNYALLVRCESLKNGSGPIRISVIFANSDDAESRIVHHSRIPTAVGYSLASVLWLTCLLASIIPQFQANTERTRNAYKANVCGAGGDGIPPSRAQNRSSHCESSFIQLA